MNCNETFNAGVCYVTDAYKSVCRFNEELHADLEKYRTENAKLRELVRSMHDELVSCEDNGYVCGGHKFDERVRELGVEV